MSSLFELSVLIELIGVEFMSTSHLLVCYVIVESVLSNVQQELFDMHFLFNH